MNKFVEHITGEKYGRTSRWSHSAKAPRAATLGHRSYWYAFLKKIVLFFLFPMKMNHVVIG